MTGKDLYRQRLTQAPDATTALEQVLAREDEYKEMFRGILRKGGVSEADINNSYSGWRACCGGRGEFMQLLREASTDVAAAVANTGADVPEYYCGPWPAWDLNASSLRAAQGAVVYVNTGLVVALRYVTQHVADCLPEILADEWGPRSQRAANEISELLAKYLSEEDLQRGTRVLALGGPPEQARREFMYGALRYVVAHESGHLAKCRPWQGGWTNDNQKFQTNVPNPYELPPADSEVQVLRAANSEHIADLIAAAALRQPPCSPNGEVHPGHLLGAMCVPLLESAVWWRLAALTDRPLGWSHPFPDFRVSTLLAGLTAPAEENASQPSAESRTEEANRTRTPLEDLGRRFYNWAQTTFGMERCRELVDIESLRRRGLNPLSLVFIYMTMGAPPAPGASDVLLAAQARLRPAG